MTFGKDAPTLTPFQAAAFAKQELAQKFPRYNDVPIVSVYLHIMPDRRDLSGSRRRGFYVVCFFRTDLSGSELIRHDDFSVVVLLDGSVILPRPESEAEPSVVHKSRIRIIKPETTK